MELLTPQEIEWLNTYHAKVKHELAPHLDSSEQKWLNQKCKAI
jgi:Xaa-Pro aminopeptidase